jgi:hypothetical protein
LIWIDEALGLPIKFENKSNGMRVTVELSEITLEVDEAVFQIPADYHKLGLSELLDRLNVPK